MKSENYNINIEYNDKDLKNIMIEIFEGYCAKKILEKN